MGLFGPGEGKKCDDLYCLIGNAIINNGVPLTSMETRNGVYGIICAYARSLS